MPPWAHLTTKQKDSSYCPKTPNGPVGPLLRFLNMEQCRVCAEDAVVVMILDDGARVPYCREHIRMNWSEEEREYDRLVKALREFHG